MRYAFGAEVRAYERGDRELKPGPKPGLLLDAAGKTWRAREDGLHGPGGEKLKRVTSDLGYWFAWFGFHPQTTLQPAPKKR